MGAHLARARRGAFVGRVDELRWLERLLAADTPAVGWVHGPGGTGKSALLRRWADEARVRGHSVAMLDLQQMRATPSEIIAALGEALGTSDEALLAERLAAAPRTVVLVDTWELGSACDGWMREVFLPSLPPQALLVFASVPSELHRQALRLCAHARHTTEGLLREMLCERSATPETAPHALFDWLRALPFVSEGARGLYPHDVARDVIDAEYRWRDPHGYRRDHFALTHALNARMLELCGVAQEEAFLELLYLMRVSPFMNRFFDFGSLGSGWVDRPRLPDDRERLQALVRSKYGDGAVPALDYWLERQRANFTVVRSPLGLPIALATHLMLASISEADRRADAVIDLVCRDIAERGELRPDERVIVTRFYAGVGSGGEIRLRHARQQLHYLREPRLAYAYMLLSQAEPWVEANNFVDFQRASELEARLATADAAPRAAFVRNFRQSPPQQWLDLLTERCLMADDDLSSVATGPTTLALSRDEFADAARDALRQYTRPDQLASNPLLGTRCVASAGDDENEDGAPRRVENLRRLIKDALESMRAHPRDAKYARAVRATYIDGASTQEAAAERLSLAFSTYRRHLARGIERATEWLWQRELDAPGQSW